MRRTFYRNRRDAGRWLAEALSDLSLTGAVSIGIGAGGTVVAWEVATRAGTRLEAMAFARISTPDRPDRTLGFVGPGPSEWSDLELIGRAALSIAELDEARQIARSAQIRRQAVFHEAARPIPLRGSHVLLVHDALAHAAPTKLAIDAVRRAGARKIWVAAPVGDPLVCRELAWMIDRLECPLQPRWFLTAHDFYDDFARVPDSTVRRLLAAAGHERDPSIT